jgi:hypothetical protein
MPQDEPPTASAPPIKPSLPPLWQRANKSSCRKLKIGEIPGLAAEASSPPPPGGTTAGILFLLALISLPGVDG